MTSRTFIAVDPGASGGLAWSNRTGVHCAAMPDTRRGVIDLIVGILADHEIQGCEGSPVAFTEKINGYLPPGSPMAHMFEFGRNVERPGAILETLGVKLVEITPQVWQKCLGLGTKGTERAKPRATTEEKALVKGRNLVIKRDWKRKLCAEAERRFPGIRVTLKSCDALLILEAGIRLEGQALPFPNTVNNTQGDRGGGRIVQSPRNQSTMPASVPAP